MRNAKCQMRNDECQMLLESKSFGRELCCVHKIVDKMHFVAAANNEIEVYYDYLIKWFLWGQQTADKVDF